MHCWLLYVPAIGLNSKSNLRETADSVMVAVMSESILRQENINHVDVLRSGGEDYSSSSINTLRSGGD